MLSSLAVVLEQPERVSLTQLPLDAPAAADIVVETRWSGISSGTERLLFAGRMPPFPGMGYPLVPGYESVGSVVEAGPEAGIAIGAQVFVPGARCFGPVRGLHGGDRLASRRFGFAGRSGLRRARRKSRAHRFGCNRLPRSGGVLDRRRRAHRRTRRSRTPARPPGGAVRRNARRSCGRRTLREAAARSAMR